jgi:hypothetical protein
MAGVSRASVQGRVALGRRAGARLLALGRDPDALWAIAGGGGMRIWTASICTRTSRCGPGTAIGWSNSIDISCGRRWRKSGCG